MTVSRPVLLGVLGLVLAAAAFLATRGMAGSEQTAPAPSPDAAAQRAGGKPAAVAGRGERRAGTSARARAERRAADRRRAARRAERARTRRAVAAALARDRTTVLFVAQRRGADDRETAAAVAALRRTRAAVFTIAVSEVGRYAPILGGLGIVQAPATVVVGRGRRARVLQGYIDARSLRQVVADARR